jgi:hypothetical protein
MRRKTRTIGRRRKRRKADKQRGRGRDDERTRIRFLGGVREEVKKKVMTMVRKGKRELWNTSSFHSFSSQQSSLLFFPLFGGAFVYPSVRLSSQCSP